MSTRFSGLARRFVHAGLISESEADEAVQLARQDDIPLITHLVRHRIADGARIARLAAEEFGAPVLDLQAFDLGQCPTDLVDVRLLRKHRVLPLYRRGSRLFLATSDPTDLTAFDELKFHTGLTTDIVVVNEDHLGEALDRMIEQLEGGDSLLGAFDDAGLEELDVELGETEAADETTHTADAADEAPVVRFVNKVLVDAIRQGASDIHIEPYEKAYRVRYRTDGVLREVARPPLTLAPRIASRLKIMSKMDISERRLPQDGRIKMKLSRNHAIDFRVNTLPTLWGEKIVLRILDPGSAQMGIDALGYEEEQKAFYMKALSQSQGMILVTGPTGSGKTVSLYTGLNILNTAERNISTAEDPVEINLEGINQVAVNNKVGLDFATALRSFLRQDPDIVMVGEIRDLETAEIAVKAAQTGHLVLSTLHTNSAPETLTRLRNMGVPSFNIATSVSLIIAQRLGRRLCTHCREAVTLPDAALQEAGFTKEQRKTAQLHRAVGCDKCIEGYKGRVGIYEVMPVTDAISRIIMKDGNALEIADQARKEGFNSLRQSALVKAANGLISLEEANRLTG
ncbi:MAG: type IV-A pilus assembly ATPase PilB [Pseudohongiellaceae bacterium]